MLAIGMAVADIEQHVERKVQHKFDVIAARKESEVQHRKDVRSWAKIADAAEYRRKTYEARKILAERFVKLNVCGIDEAMQIAKTMLPL